VNDMIVASLVIGPSAGALLPIHAPVYAPVYPFAGGVVAIAAGVFQDGNRIYV
jgi:hypothetical protein